MSVLEYLASLAALFVAIGFVVAWESESNFGAHLRKQAKLTGWAILGISKKPIGWAAGTAALILAPFSASMAKYHEIRAYRPRHCGY